MGKLSSLGLLRGPQGPTGPAGSGGSGGVGPTGPTGPTGGGSSALLNYSTVNHTVNITSSNLGGNYQVGCEFFITSGAALKITGVRFNWVSAAATVRCSLWEGNITRVAMVDFAAPGTGIHTALFSTPYNLPVNRYNTPLIVTVWHTSSYPKVSGSTEEPFYPARPFYDGARIIWKHWARFGSGDTTITSAESGCFPVEPILALQ